MTDGIRIALTLYLPDGAGPFPAVVESLPYRKDDDCTARDWETFSSLAARGLAGLRNDFWLHGSPVADYSTITCPTLLIGGWLDGYVDGMLAMAEHLTCPTRTVIG